MGNITMSLSLEGEDEQQIDALMAYFIQATQSAAASTGEPVDIEFVRASKTNLTIKRLLSNLPVQMDLGDAEQLRGLIRQMAEHSPGPAQLALEIIDAAILLR
jgi:hypothetical protein